MPLSGQQQQMRGQGGGLMAGADFQRQKARQARKAQLQMAGQQLQNQKAAMELETARRQAPYAEQQAQFEAQQAQMEFQQEALDVHEQQMDISEREAEAPLRELDRQQRAVEKQMTLENQREKTELNMMEKRAEAEQHEMDVRQARAEEAETLNDMMVSTLPADRPIQSHHVQALRDNLSHMGLDPDEHGLPDPDEMTEKDKTELRQALKTAQVNADVVRDQMEKQRQLELDSEKAIRNHELVRLHEYERQLLNRIENDGMDDLSARQLEDVQAKIRDKGGRPSESAMQDIIHEKSRVSQARTDIEAVLTMIEDTDTSFGVRGGIQQIFQRGIDAGSDIGQMFGADVQEGAQHVMTDVHSRLERDVAAYGDENDELEDMVGYFDPNLPQLAEFEKALAYDIARARWGPGRLNQQAVEQARESVRIFPRHPFDFFGEQDVYHRLEAVYNQLGQRERALQYRYEGEMPDSDSFESRFTSFRQAGQPMDSDILDPDTVKKQGTRMGVIEADDGTELSFYETPAGFFTEEGERIPPEYFEMGGSEEDVSVEEQEREQEVYAQLGRLHRQRPRGSTGLEEERPEQDRAYVQDRPFMREREGIVDTGDDEGPTFSEAREDDDISYLDWLLGR